MNDPYVCGTALRAMLERATADEPHIGPVVQNALVAGRADGYADGVRIESFVQHYGVGDAGFDGHEHGRTTDQGRRVSVRRRDRRLNPRPLVPLALAGVPVTLPGGGGWRKRLVHLQCHIGLTIVPVWWWARDDSRFRA